MINISVINVGSKSYSVKYDINIDHENQNNANIKIIGVDLVDPITLSSYKKIKTVFERKDLPGVLNRDRYGLIYDNLISLIKSKYKSSSITFI